METLLQRMLDDLDLRGRSPQTIKSYRDCVQRLEHYFKRCPSKLTAEDIRHYLLFLRNQRKLALASIAVHTSALKFFYGTTLQRPHMAAKLVQPKYRSKPRVVLNQKEVTQVIAAARTPKLRAIVCLLYGTGLRVAELCALRPEDIDSDNGVLRINCGKGGKPRQVMLSARLLYVLREFWKTRRAAPPKGRGQWHNSLLATISRAFERRKLRAEASLFRACQAIFATSEQERLPRTIVEVAKQVMRADDVSLMLPDGKDNLYVACSCGLDPELQRQVVVRLGDGIAGRAALERRPVLINGRDENPKTMQHHAGIGCVLASFTHWSHRSGCMAC